MEIRGIFEHESRLLRAYALPQSPPAFAIRTIVLLAHTGLVAKCLYVLACKHAVRPAAWQHFHSKIMENQESWH